MAAAAPTAAAAAAAIAQVGLNINKPTKNDIQKIREIDTSSQFDKFSINSAAHNITGNGNQVIFFSAETFNEKLVKSDQVNLFLAGFISLKTTVRLAHLSLLHSGPVLSQRRTSSWHQFIPIHMPKPATLCCTGLGCPHRIS
jgi:hypothetical protein